MLRLFNSSRNLSGC